MPPPGSVAARARAGSIATSFSGIGPRDLRRAQPARPVQSLRDCTESFIPAADWLGASSLGRDPEAVAERRAEGLLDANRGVLREMRIDATVQRRSGRSAIRFLPSTRVGAVPLVSPVSGRPELGLVVEPRISWRSAGDMLAGTGFRVVPELLPLADLPQSERRVPPWVLSSVVLHRLERLLEAIRRRFVIEESDLLFPRGQVLWESYVRSRLPTGRGLEVPCRYPDLRDDEAIRGAIAWTARHHRDALSTQREAGKVVRDLVARCDIILQRLGGVVPRRPSPGLRRGWQSSRMPTTVFREGLQAIDWTADQRGLAGLADLSGLSWRLDMEVFFEAWLESIAEGAARLAGARLQCGRRQQTRVPLAWEPPSLGSQQSLVPDLVIERSDVVMVIHAKYKRHAQQIESLGWQGVDERVREDHRDDLLQALAYSTLFDAPRVISCLAYPAPPDEWLALSERNRAIARTRVPARGREVELVLMSVPLSGDVIEGAKLLARVFRDAVPSRLS